MKEPWWKPILALLAMSALVVGAIWASGGLR